MVLTYEAFIIQKVTNALPAEREYTQHAALLTNEPEGAPD
jgi:hypothetical protein